MTLKEALNEQAWRDFVLFAWGEEGAHAAFRNATGRPQRPRRGATLDAMIDRACGVTEDEGYMDEFVNWVTINHWGANYAPDKWQRRAQARPAEKESESG